MTIESAPVPVHDDAWFETQFSRYASHVYGYLRRRMPDAANAEDLTADVFATAWRRRLDVPDGMELAWLYRTASFVLANHRRKGRPIPWAGVGEEQEGTDDVEATVVEDDRVRAALEALSVRDRRILLLHAWEGLGGEELAVALGITRGGADAALSRARARLRAVWDEDGKKDRGRDIDGVERSPRRGGDDENHR